MIAVVLTVALIAIWLQLFRANSILLGIYLILERHYRPEGAQPEQWVNILHKEAKDRRPPFTALLFNVGLLAVIVAAVALLLIWL